MIINQAPGTVTATTRAESLAVGTDSKASGQTSALDTAVPSGVVIKYIEIQHALVNLTATAAFIHCSIQLLLDDQSVITPDVVGGNDKRNQVHFQRLLCASPDQNTNLVWKFKIPKRFQRIRAGMSWQYVWKNSQTVSSAVQTIYKFYS